MMRITFLNIFKLLLLLTIAAGLLLFAFRGMDVKKIFSEMIKADLLWVTLSALFSVAAFISRAYRWKLLIEPLGYSPSLKTTTYSLMVGYFANLAFPRLGEITRCGALNKAEKIPFNKLLGTVIVERAIDVLSLLLCMLLASVIEFKRLGYFFKENILDPSVSKIQQLAKSPIAQLAALFLLAAVVIVLFFYFKKTRKKSYETGFTKLIKGLLEGLRSVANLKRPWLFIFHSILIWLLYYLGVYVCLFAFPFTTGLGFNAALFLLVAGGIGMSAPVQGGIGAYHLLVSQGLVLYGLSRQDGLAFATLLHSLQLLLVVIFGLTSLLLLFYNRKYTNSNRL
jgi:hypothetical protein